MPLIFEPISITRSAASDNQLSDKKYDLATLKEMFPGFEIYPTGSNYICDPPVENTDRDFVMYVRKDREDEVLSRIIEWEPCGKYERTESVFSAWRFGDCNLICVKEYELFLRWKVATAAAKHFNLLEKEDRIALFTAVLENKWDDLSVLDF